MKYLIYSSLRNIFLFTVSSFIIITSAKSQNRGSFSFASPKASFIEQRADIPRQKIISNSEKLPSAFNQKFVSTTGGISFENIATIDSMLNIEHLNLNYYPNNSDGVRLELRINKKEVKSTIYDWQLIPIAKFVESNNTSCFTYFGRLENQDLEKLILENEGHVLNYHPDFANTLLGWRLADMDMLILYNFTIDLPKLNEKYILGAGENKPDLKANMDGSRKFLNHINTIQNIYGYRFQSYVITDYSRTIECRIENDSLLISGFPYYYCWNFKFQEPGFDINAVADSLKRKYEQLIDLKREENPISDYRELIIDSLISASVKYEKNYQFYESGTFATLVSLHSYDEKKLYLEKYSFEALAKMLIEVCTQMISREPIYLKAFSDQMSAFPNLISNHNPAVWNATVNTMRFSAFFRYIKLNFPIEWEKFYAQVENLTPYPFVTTPTVIYDTGNKTISDALKQQNQNKP
ncbi:MAG: hypothetical protein HN778_21020 [Prolixibacteraceae bacterium]|jgi:hypothetical protein|nr:hypothetical protein [Prolixibacteraceae bacterium]MBT6765783.1 hypothetical protein [Prolixibacteraceae bacterium]MBT7000937.1 hypothetical protein [Prolixibacteraceae bacterium]MBT7397318.1 hypothetical protein [Prolixibacteraceae bacterium]